MIPTQTIISAIERFGDEVITTPREAENYRHLNATHFVRSLYFRLENEKKYSRLVSAIRVVEKKLNRFEQ
jgi:hypothetical protein